MYRKGAVGCRLRRRTSRPPQQLGMSSSSPATSGMSPGAARSAARPPSHFRHEPGGMKLLSSAPGELLIDMGGQATWSLRATDDELVLRLEAPDATGLQDLGPHLAPRTDQTGRRDGLVLHWQPVG